MKQITVAIAGLGSRGLDAYARFQDQAPEEMKITAVADILPHKVERAAGLYHTASEGCFDSAEAMFSQERLADVAFICTMDRQHFAHAKAALLKGYDLLLEKPISPDLQDCIELEKLARELGRTVIVCHVLRYTHFYQKLKELLDEDTIGDLVSIQAKEKVGYWHQAHSFVRGNWRNSQETSPMILQKSSHDMDIILWLAGRSCKTVSSFGSLSYFVPSSAPQDAADRCLDCPHQESCLYSAPKFYLGEIEAGRLGWPVNVLSDNPSNETIMEALREGPYGRCVYRCDNDVVDHQVVNLLLEDGITVDFTMSAFTAKGGREIHLMGTRGEIFGDMAQQTITVHPFGGEEQTVDLTQSQADFTGHGGGDEGIVRDLMSLLQGNTEVNPRISTLARSIESHAVCLAAEASRLANGKTVCPADLMV